MPQAPSIFMWRQVNETCVFYVLFYDNAPRIFLCKLAPKNMSNPPKQPSAWSDYVSEGIQFHKQDLFTAADLQQTAVN